MHAWVIVQVTMCKSDKKRKKVGVQVTMCESNERRKKIGVEMKEIGVKRNVECLWRDLW